MLPTGGYVYPVLSFDRGRTDITVDNSISTKVIIICCYISSPTALLYDYMDIVHGPSTHGPKRGEMRSQTFICKAYIDDLIYKYNG